MNINELGRFAQDLPGMTNQVGKTELDELKRKNLVDNARPVKDVSGINTEISNAPSRINPDRGSFGDTLQGMLHEVSNLQQQANTGSQRLMTGEVEDVHQVMVAVEKASTSFMLMMEIRNKLVEAYREVMRMQV